MTWPTFEPLIPSSLWLALAAVAAVMLIWYARRRPGVVSPSRWWGMVGLMALCVAAVLLVLLNPTWVEKVPPPEGKPVLVVLVDSSASMATPDAAGGGTRWSAGSRVASDAIKRLSKKFDVRVKTFTDVVTSADAKDLPSKTPSGMTTDLASALAGGMEQDRPAGQAVLLVSDGIHNAGGGASRVLEAVRVAKALGAPVYTRTLGGDQSSWDVAVEIRSPQDLSFVKQKVPLTVRVRSSGLVGAAKTDVVVLKDGKEVARRAVELSGMSPSDVHFMVSQDSPGLYPYEVKALPLPGEVSQGNNSASYLLRVVDEPIRVLVLEGKPYWDSKFLTRTLAADPAVALDSVVKMAEGRFIRRTLSKASGQKPQASSQKSEEGRTESWKVLTDVSEVLGSADRLKGYQVVVLGRDAEVFLNEGAVSNLQNWIASEGGSLVCYRGAPMAQVGQGMGKLMPVKWTPARESRVRVKLTERGKDLQWMGGAAPEAFGRLPALATGAQVDSTKALAVVLATAVGSGGQEMPAVVYQPYGSGRVVVIEGAGMWRWAFLPPAAQKESEEVYGSLWHSLLRWLISGAQLLPGQKMTLRTDKVSFNTNENATVTLLMREEGAAKTVPQVELIREGEAKGTAATPAPVGDEPGSFRVSFGKLAEGRYSARIVGAAAEDASARTVFDVKMLGEEQLNLAARPDLMKRIADDSGGIVLANQDVGEIEKRFEEHMEKIRPAAVRRTTAWDRWWVLVLVLGLWGVTWAVRRSGGLV
jgi:hypothetical protein